MSTYIMYFLTQVCYILSNLVNICSICHRPQLMKRFLLELVGHCHILLGQYSRQLPYCLVQKLHNHTFVGGLGSTGFSQRPARMQCHKETPTTSQAWLAGPGPRVLGLGWSQAQGLAAPMNESGPGLGSTAKYMNARFQLR